MFNSYRVSVLLDEIILEIHRRDGRVPMWISLMPQTCILNSGSNGTFYVKNIVTQNGGVI